VAFLSLLCTFLPSFTILEFNSPTTLYENKDGYISLPSNLSAIIGITSYYSVILKLVIVYCMMQQKNSKWGFCVYSKQRTKPVFCQKKKSDLKRLVGCFFKKRVFINPDCVSILFVIFP